MSNVSTYDAELSRYIERVRALPTLTREEEYDLAADVASGDPAAVTRLVEANLRFVVAVALQYRRYGLRLSDLIAEGNLGLMLAVRKFDRDRGTRFVTYAGYWIRAYVLDFIVRSASMVGAGSGALRSKVYFRLRRERARIANLVEDPQRRNAILAETFNVSPEKMEEMSRRVDNRDLSLDLPAHAESQTTLLDMLAEPADNQEQRYLDEEQEGAFRSSLEQALRTLDKRERFIVEQRFLNDEEASLAAIGRSLGVSRERARQLEARAKDKLRERLAAFEPERKVA